MAAADCILDLTKALTRKMSVSDVSSRRSKSFNSNASNLQTTIVQAAIGVTKVKPTSQSAEFSNKLEMEFVLWDHTDNLIILVQRLLAVCSKLIFVLSICYLGLNFGVIVSGFTLEFEELDLEFMFFYHMILHLFFFRCIPFYSII